MKRLFVIMLFVALFSFSSFSQPSAEMENVIRLMGNQEPEEMDSEEVERILSYMENPLRLNSSSLQKFEDSGFLSRYQITSLADYKKRHGPVMSLSELALLDGFGEDFVRKIAPFISLTVPDVRSENQRLAGNLSLRTSLRSVNEADGEYTYGLKGVVGCGERFSASIGLTAPYCDRLKLPETFTGSVSYLFRSLPLRIIVGDFNARFGQGLALWNGMSINGIGGTPESFMRNPTALSAVKSYTGNTAFTGMAADLSFGGFRLSAMMSLPGIKNGRSGLMPALNLSWYGSFMELGFTHYAESDSGLSGGKMIVTGMKTSVNMALCVNGRDVFSEVAYDWSGHAVAGIAGVVCPIRDMFRLASMVRYYPAAYSPDWSGAYRSRTRCSNEYGVTICGSYRSDDMARMVRGSGFVTGVRRCSGTLSADASYYPVPVVQGRLCMQFKLQTEWTFMLSESFRLRVRATERMRTWGQPYRTDIRLDMTWFSSRFTFTVRSNILDCRGTGGLVYAEGGYEDDRFSSWLRLGFFLVDEWDDRIYVYERDVPGSFNVPAFYGRGVWASLTGRWNISRHLKLCFRASVTEYPFMKKKKPGKAELRIQGVIGF